MREIIKSLRRLYQHSLIKQEKITEMFKNEKITEEEKWYILDVDKEL